MNIEMVSANLYFDLFEKYNKLKSSLTVKKSDSSEILDYLNNKTGKHYRHMPVNLDFIKARIKEGATLEECKAVIDLKCADWIGTDMSQFLRPATLFNKSKFWQYHGEIEF